VYMPGMNGVQLAEQLRAQRPGLRVLFMSGHVDDRAVLEQIRANGDGIVDKPFTTDSLLQLVQSTLASLPA
jgi:two-component system cell cycle sensor histidine kinase/response regulator CckA